MKVIVLDGNERSALAVSRSLGKRGINVIVGAPKLPSLASSSRYCSSSFSYPSPDESPAEFIRSIRQVTAELGKSVLLPMTDVAVAEILRNREAFLDQAEVPFAGYDKYVAASDKVNLFKLALRLGVPTPSTIFATELDNRAEIAHECSKLGYPVVIKPARSRLLMNNRWIRTNVRYARGDRELLQSLDDEPFRDSPYIVQERIEGPGVGIFVLFNQGRAIARFAHKRIREKPPSGGVSVLCESISPPPVALKMAEKLLRNLDWFGIAMVEFKWDKRDDLPKLMEINARFWGSLQLAISSGVDFPYLLFLLAMGQRIEPQEDYRLGVKSRWELGDLDHLLLRMVKNKKMLALPKDAPPRLSVLRDFMLDFFRPSVRNEILRIDDPSPIMVEFREYLRNLWSSTPR